MISGSSKGAAVAKGILTVNYSDVLIRNVLFSDSTAVWLGLDQTATPIQARPHRRVLHLSRELDQCLCCECGLSGPAPVPRPLHSTVAAAEAKLETGL